MKSTILAATAALGVMAAVPALADTASTSPRSAVMFWMIDRNGDATIDRGEIQALRAVIFDAIDLDHDGRLTKAEAESVADKARGRVADRVAAAIRLGPAKITERRDLFSQKLGLDQPGGLARADFVDRDPKLFAQADADASGGISKQEFDVMAGALAGAILAE
jgi:hypothetical protein